jgi:RNA polymerase sigma-70 factor (sigma-E family)
MRTEDEKTFDAFVRARAKYFLRVSVLLTGSVPEGEDLLQTSLVRLHRAWPRLNVSSSAPDAYLRKILVNTRRSWWQVRWRREWPVDSIPDVPDSGDFTDRHAVGAVVRSALAVLPRQQRAVLVLRYVEDLPESQVASLLGVSAGTVKVHAHRGLRALRKSLGDLAPFPVNGAGGTEGVER